MTLTKCVVVSLALLVVASLACTPAHPVPNSATHPANANAKTGAPAAESTTLSIESSDASMDDMDGEKTAPDGDPVADPHAGHKGM